MLKKTDGLKNNFLNFMVCFLSRLKLGYPCVMKFKSFLFFSGCEIKYTQFVKSSGVSFGAIRII